jgi:hypothetical protein
MAGGLSKRKEDTVVFSKVVASPDESLQDQHVESRIGCGSRLFRMFYASRCKCKGGSFFQAKL